MNRRGDHSASHFAAPRFCPFHSKFCGHVENEREVRLQPVQRHALQSLDQFQIDLAELALIDAGGIGEAVAQHPDALPQGWLDDVMHMVVARGGKQHGFSFRPDQLAHALQ